MGPGCKDSLEKCKRMKNDKIEVKDVKMLRFD
jgi:hypothetical protein